LVAITPASGFVLPRGSLVNGIAAGIICFWAATSLKHMLGYDDSLDAFGVHGIGGIAGALLTGVFSFGPLSATDASPDGSPGGLPQLKLPAIGVLSTVVYTGVMS
jgi:ammonium transporter, Amt family